MNYLLDTCVLSEFTRRQPDQQVIAWLNSVSEENLFISVITIGEIQRGIERLPDSARKTELISWLNQGLLQRFADRTLAIDAETMLLWGSLTTRMESQGKPLSVMDSLIIASALQNNLVVSTRNVNDFQPSGVRVINPWD
jgi:predicted nucleic acid-binding protein